jgi:3D (Asp-Asp-Asp) domain-containing protein
LIAVVGASLTQLAIAYTLAHSPNTSPPEITKPPPTPPPIVAKAKRMHVAKARPTVQQPAWQTYEITSYTSGYESTQKHEGDAGYGITASGTKATEGVTVACPQDLPFGTTVDIEGIGERTCLDRGGDINGRHIDLYVNDVKRALDFGVQERKVEIIRKGDD